MSIKQELMTRTLALCEKEGLEFGINWLIDNIHDHYKRESERLERKLVVRDRLLFKHYNGD